MIVNKVTTGFVVQRFDTKTRKFLSQEFVASDECAFENDDGDNVETFTEYLPYEMVQPESGEEKLTLLDREAVMAVIDEMEQRGHTNPVDIFSAIRDAVWNTKPVVINDVKQK